MMLLLHFLSHGQLILNPSKPRHKEASLTNSNSLWYFLPKSPQEAAFPDQVW